MKSKAKVTSKGQVTIPIAIRERMGIRPGDQLEFDASGTGLRITKTRESSPFAQWRGVLKPIEGMSVDELLDEMRGREHSR